METYLMMLYVTLDQESALKNFFSDQGWTFSKPDLSVTTDKLGPSIGNAPANFNKDDTDLECPPAVPGKRKANATQRKAPKIKLAKILPTSTDVKSSTESVSRKTQEKEDAIDEEAGIFDEMTMAQYDVKEVGNMIFKMKKRKENSSEEIAEGNHDAADNNIDDVGDEENDDTDSIEGINDEDNEEKPDGSSVSNKSIKKEIQEMNKTNTKKEYHQKKLPKKSLRAYSLDAMIAAYHAVKDDSMTIRKAAKMFEVPYTSLFKRVNGLVKVDCTRSGPCALFSREQEAELIKHLKHLRKNYSIKTKKDICSVASEYAKKLGLRTEGLLSYKWLTSLEGRWGLSIKDLFMDYVTKDIADEKNLNNN